MGADYDYLFKIVLIGDPGVGKTNLMTRFSKNEFRFEHKPTDGVDLDTHTINVDGKIIKAHIYDTAGEERYRSLTTPYYQDALGAFLVYDITRTETLKNAEGWLRELQRQTDQKTVIMLVGNKSDTKYRHVQMEDAKAFAEREKIKLFMETSALNMSNVKNAFTKMLTQIYHVASKSKKLHCYRNRMPEPKRQTIKDEGHKEGFVTASRRHSQDHNGLRTNIEPPKLSSDNYFTIWKHRMISYLNLVDIKLWETIKEGRHTPPLKERNKWSDEDKRKVALDKKAMQILSVSLPDNIYPCVMCCESAKDMWDTLVVVFEGGEDIRESRRSVVIKQYELFRCNSGESLTESFIRFKCLVNEMIRHQCKTFDNEEMVNKFLESLPIEWKSMAIMIRQMGDLKTMSLEGLYGHLMTHKLETEHDAWMKVEELCGQRGQFGRNIKQKVAIDNN